MSFINLLPTVFALPPTLLCSDFFDLIESVKPASVNSGASLGCVIPSVLIFKIHAPERPGSALVWPDWVNLTTFAALQKDAVVIDRILQNGSSIIHLLGIIAFKLFNAYAE
jgi:hypothetical protein